MAKLIVRNETYHSVSSTAFFEVEYERLVLSHAGLLFPEHHAVPFKKRVESETGRVAADLALIERNYRKWWVVEVELAHHSFTGHVLPQVSKLATANYGPDVGTYLADQSDDLDAAPLHEMMKGSQPQVLVIVNDWQPSWQQSLSALGALLSVVEVFRSDQNNHILRLNGAYPTIVPDVLSTLRFDTHIPRLMVVDSPAALDWPPGDRLQVEFEGNITEWVRVDIEDKVWLSPLKSNPLPPGGRYGLVKREGGYLAIRILR